MTKRRKLVIGVLGTVLLGGWLVCWNLGRIVKVGIEYFGPRVLGVPVTVGSVFLSPLGGYCRLSGLEIGNPPGYREKTLMRIASVTAKLELGSITGDKIVLREVEIHSPEIHWEGDLSGSNVSRLEAQAQRAASHGTSGGGGGQAPAEKAILIRKLAIKNARADVLLHLLGERRMQVDLPPLRMTNVGSQNPETAAGKIAGALLGQIGDALVQRIRAQAVGF